jgi:hypothetical protein
MGRACSKLGEEGAYTILVQGKKKSELLQSLPS